MTTITKLSKQSIPLPSAAWKNQIVYIFSSPNTITIKKIESSKTNWNELRKKLKKAGELISETEIQKEITGYRLNRV